MTEPVQRLAGGAGVRAALASFRRDLEGIVARATAIQQIPAPTFAEKERAAFIEEQFRAAGLEQVEQDQIHNVFGLCPGRTDLAPVVISAHSDTVFDSGTDLALRRNGDRLYAPGIADNSLGVASLITLARAVRDFELAPKRPIWFVSNVGEEGLGNLKGMKQVVARFPDAAAFIVVEGGLYGFVCHQAIGVRRHRVTVSGPGGHSWGAAGTPSAIHVLGRIIAALSEQEITDSPKTTYNVGVIEGGTTINTIAARASMQVDLRSEDPAALVALEQVLEQIIERHAQQRHGITVETTLIGDRPAGQIDAGAPLVRSAVAALRQVGCENVDFTMGSTDANEPLGKGLPAVCIGITRAGNTHRLDEYMELEPIPSGLGQALLLTLAAASA